MTDPASVMVYSMGEIIGDGLIKLPFIAGLRAAFPEAKIAWCAGKGETVYAGPLKGVVDGLIDEVLTAPPTGADIGDWLKGAPFGGRRFDIVVDTQMNLRRSLFARRAAKSLFVSPAANFLASQRRPEVWPEALVEQFGALLALASDGRGALQPLTLANPRATAAAQALLPGGPTYVGFAPGAGGVSRRWPLANYLALANLAAEQGAKPVFFFGPQEMDDVAAAKATVPDALFPELDRTDDFQDVRGPLLVIALAARLAAAVANDAGPGHMLAAGGAPLLSLQQDARKAVKFKPAARRLEMLVAEDYGGGMDAIPVSAAAERLSKLLSEA